MISHVCLILLLAFCCVLIRRAHSQDSRTASPHRGCYLAGQTIHDLSSNGFKLSDLKPSLCTYIVYGYGTVQDNELQIKPRDEEILRMLQLTRAVIPNMQLFLALDHTDTHVTEHFSSSFISLHSRADFVSTVMEKLRIWNLDGLFLRTDMLDDGSASVMAVLIKDIRTKFDEDKTATKLRLVLGIHVGHDAKTSKIEPVLIANSADIVEVHTFDYHTSTIHPAATGHGSPLLRNTVPGSHSGTVEYSLQSWLQGGVPKSKLVVGFPLYGPSWTLMKVNRFEAGAPAIGPAPSANYSNKTGLMFYHDICEQIANNNLTRVFDSDSMTPYAHDNDTRWVSYDDAVSFSIKARWIMEKGYGGVYFYELSMGDFDGSCGMDSYAALQAVEDVFSATSMEKFQEKRECDRKFCISRAVGVYALGSCMEAYCSCDYGGKAYRFPCGPGTVFDPLNLACNYATAVKGCEQPEDSTKKRS